MRSPLDNKKIMFFVLDAILIVIFVLIIVMNNQKNQVGTPTDAEEEVTSTTIAAAEENETEPADTLTEAEGSENLLIISAGEDSRYVTWTFRESFDEDYYDFDELQEAVESEAEEFNSALEAEGAESAGGAYLTVESCELKTVTTDGQEGYCVEISLLFDSVESFVRYYNEYTNPDETAYLFCGTIADAQTAGYVFEELYENGGGDVAYLTEELMLEENVYAVLTNLEIDLEIEDTVLCWDENVTEEDEVFHTVAGNQNTIIAAAE